MIIISQDVLDFQTPMTVVVIQGPISYWCSLVQLAMNPAQFLRLNHLISMLIGTVGMQTHPLRMEELEYITLPETLKKYPRLTETHQVLHGDLQVVHIGNCHGRLIQTDMV